jgi:hypothetical protein
VFSNRAGRLAAVRLTPLLHAWLSAVPEPFRAVRLAQPMHSDAGSSTRAAAKDQRRQHMRGLFRGLLAGYGASKLGGGCISTIVIFLLLWWLLKNVGI